MKRSQLDSRLDLEWIVLMEEARALGITKAEVEQFFKLREKSAHVKPINMIFTK
ncbi:anti-repressor SinI family protein [Thalassobacillus devorans]|uniref:anti-repressor SinI family protein n=1 Tax=Thalassobacillus devorans TaxID=279813 RepID=UPI00111C2CD0|nr:anti-repressor SinI family protein [Thalassobacillus devorans]